MNAPEINKVQDAISLLSFAPALYDLRFEDENGVNIGIGKSILLIPDHETKQVTLKFVDPASLPSGE